MPSQNIEDYISYLAGSVMEPSAKNIAELMDTARICGIGVHEAAKDRQQLVFALERPSDADLADAAQLEQDAADKLTEARRRFAAAQGDLDKAEAEAVKAKQKNLEARSARMAGDRALKIKNVKLAFEDFHPEPTQ